MVFSMRVILDQFSVEAFFNDGNQMMSAVIMTELSARKIPFIGMGEAEMDIVKYDLRPEEEKQGKSEGISPIRGVLDSTLSQHPPAQYGGRCE